MSASRQLYFVCCGGGRGAGGKEMEGGEELGAASVTARVIFS